MKKFRNDKNRNQFTGADILLKRIMNYIYITKKPTYGLFIIRKEKAGFWP